MSAVDALYYDGQSARPLPARFEAIDGELRVEGEGLALSVPLRELHANARIGNTRRILHLPGGAQLQCDDNDAVDRLFPRHGLDVLVDRLERHPHAIVASLLLTVVAGVMFFTVGLPWMADRVARAIPPEVEAPIGEQVMDLLDDMSLAPTGLPAARQAELQKLFADFVRDLPGASRYRLEFRDWQGGEANAFAVPGGLIVFTDGLISRIRHDEEFLAVLAHEVGHQEHRHVMRSVLQQSAVVVLAAVLTGDVGSATGLALGVPAFLLESHYSRAFETEADAFAFEQLKRHDLSPEWFAQAFDSILAEEGAVGEGDGEDPYDDESSLFDYVSSHPPTPERTTAARAAAHGMEPVADIIAARAGDEPEVSGSLAEVSLAKLAGCWRGVTLSGNERRWLAELKGDGSLSIRSEAMLGGVGEWSPMHETGTWAIEHGRLVMRVRSFVDSEGVERTVNSEIRYRIVSFDDERLRYRMEGNRFEAERVACEGAAP